MPELTDTNPLYSQRFLAGDLLGKLAEELEKFQREKGFGECGGYFYFCDGLCGIPYIIAKVGQVPFSEWETYLHFCQEKAIRLVANPEHLSSRQSRDPKAKHYGGAIRVQMPNIKLEMCPVIFSFNGLSEEMDEHLMLLLAERLEILTPLEADEIANLDCPGEQMDTI